MLPDLVSIGPLTLHSYGLFVALGIAAALLAAARIAKGSGIDARRITDMGLIMVLWAVIGSRLMYIFFNLSHYARHPIEMFKIWEGGLVFSGGLLAAAPALIWYLKKHDLPVLATADCWAPALALGQGIGRIGCFMSGCCYGKPTDLPWGISFFHPHSLAPLNVPLHPTQIYASLIGFLIFGILIILMKRKTFAGQVFLWFLILHSTGRLLVERYRGDYRGMIPGAEMSPTQMVALLILLASVTALFLKGPRKDRNRPQS